jgi:hypothetical protein
MTEDDLLKELYRLAQKFRVVALPDHLFSLPEETLIVF